MVIYPQTRTAFEREYHRGLTVQTNNVPKEREKKVERTSKPPKFRGRTNTSVVKQSQTKDPAIGLVHDKR